MSAVTLHQPHPPSGSVHTSQGSTPHQTASAGDRDGQPCPTATMDGCRSGVPGRARMARLPDEAARNASDARCNRVIHRANRDGMALFLVIGFLAFITVIAVWLHSFSRQHMAQTRHHTKVEIAWRAASLAARQAAIHLRRAADFINSTDPQTWPKLERAPTALRPLIENLLDRDGLPRGDPTSWELPLAQAPIRDLLAEEPRLRVTVTIALKGGQPLLDQPPIPGLVGLPGEWRGRFVIEARAAIDEVERRVMGKLEFRAVSLQWPVIGRFVLWARRGSGNPNPSSATVPPGTTLSREFPPALRPEPGQQPLVIMGGPPLTDRAAASRDPATFLDRQGWIYLGRPATDPPDYWVLGAAAGLGDTGEGFAANHLPWCFEIPQGASRLGLGNGPTALWPRFESVSLICAPFAACRGSENQSVLRNAPGDLDHYSHLRLMGTSREMAPTLVFGQVYRRYLLQQGLRPRPRFPGEVPPVALIPYVRPEDYARPDFGVPGTDPRVPPVLRAACTDYESFSTAMSLPVVAPANEAVAFALDQQSPPGLKPVFRSGTIGKLGTELIFDPARPDAMLLDGPCRLHRGGQVCFDGHLAAGLANLGNLAAARTARTFPDGAALRAWLTARIAQRQPVTGCYEVAGPFTWTDDFNPLAIGGVAIVCHGDLTIRAGVAPRFNPAIPDAAEHPVTLLTTGGDLLIATDAPIRAALLALQGRLKLVHAGDLQVEGLVAVAELPLDQFRGNRSRRIRYDPAYDWAEPAAYQRSLRLQIETQNLFFSVKPR